MQKYYVYKLQLSTGATYIGATKNFKTRLTTHKSMTKGYGVNIDSYEVLKEFESKKECSDYEQEAIKTYKAANCNNPAIFGEIKEAPTHTPHSDIHNVCSYSFEEERYSLVRYPALDDATIRFVKSKKDLQILNFFISKVTDSCKLVLVDVKELAELTGVTRQSASTAVKNLQAVNILFKVKPGVFRVNPYMVHPNVEDIATTWKHEWDSLSYEG